MGHTDDLQQPTMMVFFLRVTADEQQQCSAGICSSGSPARQHQPCSGAGGGGEAPPKLPVGIWASFVGCYQVIALSVQFVVAQKWHFVLFPQL